VRLAAREPFDGLAAHFLPANYDPPDFALRLAHKDVSLAAELGRGLGVPMPMAELALEELTAALNRGLGDRDSRAAMLLQQERAGVQIVLEPHASARSLIKIAKPALRQRSRAINIGHIRDRQSNFSGSIAG
jgi:NADP-dependent 3-hydroxyisobutyrate dehydrogenase-like protein